MASSDTPKGYTIRNFLSKDGRQAPGWLPNKPRESAPLNEAAISAPELQEAQEVVIPHEEHSEEDEAKHVAQEAAQRERQLAEEKRKGEERKIAEAMVDELNRNVAAYIKRLGTWAKWV